MGWKVAVYTNPQSIKVRYRRVWVDPHCQCSKWTRSWSGPSSGPDPDWVFVLRLGSDGNLKTRKSTSKCSARPARACR
jgi:hypothetical protein